MGLSPQAAGSIATTLVAIGVAYYYLLRKNEPPARDRPSPPTTTETSTDLASTREVDPQPQSSVVWRAVRAASRWSIGGTAIGAYEEFSPIPASKTSSRASPVPSPTADTGTNSTAPAASDLAASDAALLATLASPATPASTAEALACLAARVKAPADGDEPVDLETFLQLREAGCALLDVRSPAEFEECASDSSPDHQKNK